MEALPRRPGVIRVVLTGSESTGKSTLAVAIARHYGAQLVPEFVRAFAEQKNGPIDFNDHGPIARGQIALEDEHILLAERLLVQDTDLLSTVVYCRHYFGLCPAWIEESARARRPDLYLVCQPDSPWVADGVRDRGHLREAMQELFQQAVEASRTPSVDLRGTPQERLGRAIRTIDRLLDARHLESD
jgi:NadR type nicotinamide-nucleotide adenylyltransferase